MSENNKTQQKVKIVSVCLLSAFLIFLFGLLIWHIYNLWAWGPEEKIGNDKNADRQGYYVNSVIIGTILAFITIPVLIWLYNLIYNFYA